jgi:hypothetical protein
VSVRVRVRVRDLRVRLTPLLVLVVLVKEFERPKEVVSSSGGATCPSRHWASTAVDMDGDGNG